MSKREDKMRTSKDYASNDCQMGIKREVALADIEKSTVVENLITDCYTDSKRIWNNETYVENGEEVCNLSSIRSSVVLQSFRYR